MSDVSITKDFEEFFIYHTWLLIFYTPLATAQAAYRSASITAVGVKCKGLCPDTRPILWDWILKNQFGNRFRMTNKILLYRTTIIKDASSTDLKDHSHTNLKFSCKIIGSVHLAFQLNFFMAEGLESYDSFFFSHAHVSSCQTSHHNGSRSQPKMQANRYSTAIPTLVRDHVLKHQDKYDTIVQQLT